MTQGRYIQFASACAIGLLLLAGSPVAGAVAPGTISTVAGTGAAGCGADNILAVNSALAVPYSLALDAAGNLYIADTSNNRVRKVNAATGIVTTLAGSPICAAGFAGDGFAAGAATLLNTPTGIYVDGANNVYIADSANNRVREIVAATGKIQTIAGTGVPGCAGNNGPANLAQLTQPRDFGVDGAGNLLVAEYGGHTIRSINAAGVISIVAGTCGVPGFLGDGGPAIAAQLNFPVDVSVDNANNLYIADYQNNRIRIVPLPAGNIGTFAGTGVANPYGDLVAAPAANLDTPRGIVATNIAQQFIADTGHDVIRVVNTGIIDRIAGTAGVAGYAGDGGPALKATMSAPRRMALDAAGNLYVADSGNNAIRMIASATTAPEAPPLPVAIAAEVPLPLWALGLLGGGLAAALRRGKARRGPVAP